jgi:ADP-heptose:LPS heptosyltransferase
MKAVIFRDTQVIKDLPEVWIPGKVYIFGELQAFFILRDLSDKGVILDENIIVKDLKEILERAMDFISMKNKRILLIRGGGIGDIIALSPVVSYLQARHSPKEIVLLTDKRYSQVTDWYPDPVRVQSYMEPVFDYKLKFPGILYQREYQYISTEGFIDKSSENWIQLFFAILGQEFTGSGQEDLKNKYFRPELKQTRISDKISNIDPKRASITIVCRGSSVLRAISFFEIWQGLRAVLKDRINDFNIYTHIENTTNEDRDYMLKLYKLGYTNLNLVKCQEISDYLLDLFDSTLVISVDTSAIHFREGIHKSCIGLFNSVGTKARTGYYQYTNSYDIVSKCKLQPCYPNSVEGSEICKPGEEARILNYSPCLTSEFNPNLQARISWILEQNIDYFQTF